MNDSPATLKPVLYADDDENDQFLMERAFETLGVDRPLRLVSDGKLALDYLVGRDGYADRNLCPMPSLVMLDLSMPRKTGFDVLEWIRSQPALALLPVVILTSSSQPSDIARAYSLGATAYLVKPGDPDHLLAIVKKIEQCWLRGILPAHALKELPAYRNPS